MILNLTQHNPTPDQITEGVVNLPEETWNEVKDLITFVEPPLGDEMKRRAKRVAQIAGDFFRNLPEEYDDEPGECMVGGAPYFMTYIEQAIREEGLVPLYSFTARDVVETPLPDGTTSKSYIFKHVGWVVGRRAF